jgi:ATP/maltotriose-dependent transcriptional regulator MalT
MPRFGIAAAAIANVRGHFAASIAAAHEAVSAAERYGDPALLANCWTSLADFSRQQAKYPEAQAAIERAIEVADDHALTSTAAFARLTAADMAFLRGDAGSAHELLRFACALNVEGEFMRVCAAAIGIPIALAVEDDVLVERLGDEALLERVLRSGSDQNAAALAAAHAELRVARGDTAGARALIRAVLPRLRNAIYVYEALLKFARFGGPAEAQRAASLFSPFDPKNPLTDVHALLVRAIVETNDGDTLARDRTLHQAREIAAGFGFASLEALALADELSGDLASACARYREVGATRDLRRLADDGPRRAERALRTLTQLEREVAALVARGLSDRAIAEPLTLSNRTVEHHVAAVFAELELRSRAELTAHMARETMARS